MTNSDPTTLNSQALFVTFRDVMARVGEFMFHWSLLEQGLTNSIQEMRESRGFAKEKVDGTLPKRLEIWNRLASDLPQHSGQQATAQKLMVQVLRLKKVRNLIVHGLCAGVSMGEEGEPYICCAVGGFVEPTGATVNYTFNDLEHFAQGIDACRRGFKSLSNFNYFVDDPDTRIQKP